VFSPPEAVCERSIHGVSPKTSHTDFKQYGRVDGQDTNRIALFLECVRACEKKDGSVIAFYCGINEQAWNHHPVAPGTCACVAPVYGRTLRTKAVNRVTVPQGVQVIQDSGAFSDGPGQRLSYEAALERQVAHAEHFGYTPQITHRASYDWLIDEKWEGGVRSKARWSEHDAE
jgi:hypothetical protein